jgi:hypothetical protein
MTHGQPSKIVKIPSIVQELVASVEEPPSQYVLPQQDRPSVAGSEMPEPIPIVDLSRLSDFDNSADETVKLQSALENWGLFLVNFPDYFH